MQSLFYESSSLTLTLIKEDSSTFYWNDITNLFTSASKYETTDSGSSDFGVTIGELKIHAYSGSTIIATFPVDVTNIFYFPPPYSISAPTSSFQDSFLNLFFYNDFTSSGSFGCSISSSELYYNLTGSSSEGYFSLDNITYSLFVSGSGSYSSRLYLNSNFSGSIYALSSSNAPLSASFVPLPFTQYFVTFSLIDVKSASICIGDGTTQACDCTLSASVYFAGNFEAGTTIYSDSGLTTLYYDGVYPDISYSGSLYYVNFSESILIANGVCSLP